MAESSGALAEFDFTIRNDKTAPVDIFLVDRRTLAENFRQTVQPGASVAMRSLETDTWVARIGIEAYGILSNAFLAPSWSQTFDLGDGTKIEVTNEAQHGARFAVRVTRG